MLISYYKQKTSYHLKLWQLLLKIEILSFYWSEKTVKVKNVLLGFKYIKLNFFIGHWVFIRWVMDSNLNKINVQRIKIWHEN